MARPEANSKAFVTCEPFMDSEDAAALGAVLCVLALRVEEARRRVKISASKRVFSSLQGERG